MELTEKRCIPCRGGIPPLKGAELQKLKAKVLTWSVIEEHHLEKEFKFPDFKKELEFVNKVGALAEQEQHHPNIEFTWGKAKITIYTHKINWLHENDFILAAKIDKL